MSPHTGLHTPDDDVIARLHEASEIPDVQFDTPAVLAMARRVLRRRRRRQAFGAVIGAGLVAMTLAGRCIWRASAPSPFPAVTRCARCSVSRTRMRRLPPPASTWANC
jgi:hypothetical protein